MSSGFLTRRNFVSTSTFAVAVALSNFVSADNARDAEVLVGKLVADINNVISSGNSEQLMVKQFEEIFKLYADVPTIARYALGTDARSLSKSQILGM